jgi:hypothetical protein
MRVKALRGVCIGPGQHLAAGEVAELDTATSTFLIGIGAVAAAPAAPAVPDAPSEIITPAKPGKKER